MSCIVCNQPTEPFKSTGKYPKTCSKECLSILRSQNSSHRSAKVKEMFNPFVRKLPDYDETFDGWREREYLEKVIR